MKTLSRKLQDYGIRRMGRTLGVQPSTVWRWAQANKAPRWWHDALKAQLGRFTMKEAQ